jgi:hypothetical protein
LPQHHLYYRFQKDLARADFGVLDSFSMEQIEEFLVLRIAIVKEERKKRIREIMIVRKRYFNYLCSVYARRNFLKGGILHPLIIYFS